MTCKNCKAEHVFYVTPKLRSEKCVVCKKTPKDPKYVNVDDYRSVAKRIYPICKDCNA